MPETKKNANDRICCKCGKSYDPMEDGTFVTCGHCELQARLTQVKVERRAAFASLNDKLITDEMIRVTLAALANSTKEIRELENDLRR